MIKYKITFTNNLTGHIIPVNTYANSENEAIVKVKDLSRFKSLALTSCKEA